MRHAKKYIFIVAAAFLAFAVVFDTLPRSTVSQLEKRELATFPEFTWQRLADGSLTRDVQSWFSDSEPYRDVFMALSMNIKDLTRLSLGEDNVTFHASETTDFDQSGPVETDETNTLLAIGQLILSTDTRTVGEYENKVTADENAKIANAGIIVVGSGDKVRALMAYGGGPNGCTGYAEAANKYQEVFGPDVTVYCMVIPTSVEYYCPDKVRKHTKPERPTINHVYESLNPEVRPVDIYTTLGQHADEDIFLRTDHPWAPLGAYYAAQKFAQVAGVPFEDLSHYEQKVVHGYVGSMYGYSKDASLKRAPEDFVYYEPVGVDYTTTYIQYTINKNYHVTGESKPVKSRFFFHYRDGAAGAYCTFMGGDTKLTRVQTSTKNGRRLIILKDSFGNALPGYLFFSFEEVHVIDSRYFTKNMRQYVADNHITDILFANNIFKAYSANTYKNYVRFLEQ